MEERYSYGYNNARDAVSLTPRRQVVPLLLPDEFMGLKSLEGVIKFPDGFAAAPVILTPRDWPRRARGFVPREDARKPVGPGSKASEAAATVNADGAWEGSDSNGDPRKMKDRTNSRRPSRQRGNPMLPLTANRRKTAIQRQLGVPSTIEQRA